MKLTKVVVTSLFAVVASTLSSLPNLAQAQSPAVQPVANSEGSESGETDFDALMSEGEPLYQRNCRMCHGSSGTSGVRLADNSRATAENAARVMIKGPGYMPSFSSLSDEEIAAIATFVANSWGNDLGVVKPDDVVEFR